MGLLIIWCVSSLIIAVVLLVIIHYEGFRDQDECIAIALASIILPIGVIGVAAYLLAKLLMVISKAMNKHED